MYSRSLKSVYQCPEAKRYLTYIFEESILCRFGDLQLRFCVCGKLGSPILRRLWDTEFQKLRFILESIGPTSGFTPISRNTKMEPGTFWLRYRANVKRRMSLQTLSNFL